VGQIVFTMMNYIGQKFFAFKKSKPIKSTKENRLIT
jgi:hypothetical protein